MNNGENFNIENKFVNYDSNNKEKKKSKKFIIIILLILLLGIAGYLFYVNKVEKESNKKNNDNYEEYDPNYKIEESNSNITSNITSNTTSNIESNISSNITSNIESNITSNIISNVTSNVVKSNSNKTSNTQPKVSVNGVKLSSTKLTMTVGDTKSISATVTPSNATNKGVTWTSSNTSVATVSSNGKITAKKAGTAKITVKTKDGSKTASCTVEVKHVKVTGNVISYADIYEGTSSQLKVTLIPNSAMYQKITYQSSNTNVVSINQSGLMYGKSVGTATITIKTESGYQTSANVKVLENPKNYNIVLAYNGTYYVMYVNKNGVRFTNFKSIEYNGLIYAIQACNNVANYKVDKSKTTATLVLTDGTKLSNVSVTYK